MDITLTDNISQLLLKGENLTTGLWSLSLFTIGVLYCIVLSESTECLAHHLTGQHSFLIPDPGCV